MNQVHCNLKYQFNGKCSAACLQCRGGKTYLYVPVMLPDIVGVKEITFLATFGFLDILGTNMNI